MEATMSSSARLALFCLIGLLLVILGFLIAFAFVLRRRPEPVVRVQRTERRRDLSIEPEIDDEFHELEVSIASAGGGGAMGVAAVAATDASEMACPTCRREFDETLEYCPHDARRLIPVVDMVDKTRIGGSVCTACRRAFDPGVRYCPHDGAELIPISIYEATRGHRSQSPTGIVAKICPDCRMRYDLAATFCGKDGSELVVIN
jgi:hypothetical protein